VEPSGSRTYRSHCYTWYSTFSSELVFESAKFWPNNPLVRFVASELSVTLCDTDAL
jgi:hypothetical protein